MARKVMDESPHCALIGEGALEFALSQGFFDEICIPKVPKPKFTYSAPRVRYIYRSYL